MFCFCFIFYARRGAYLWVRAIWYVNSEMSLLTSRVTVNDNNGGTRVPLSETLTLQPLGFVPSWVQSAPVLSHVFCYVNVVTREHPRVGKHSDMGLITSDLSSVLGISALTRVYCRWCFRPDYFHSFSFTTLGVCPLCFCFCVGVLEDLKTSQIILLTDWLTDWPTFCLYQMCHSSPSLVKSTVSLLDIF